ncbi:MAG: CHAT domain-containing protein, partial [Planctomyces sp.]
MAGRTIRAGIWEPLLPHIEEAKTLLISPDGQLGELAFAALPGKQVDAYLLEDHRFCLIPIPQLLPDLMTMKPQPLERDLLLVGDVDYDSIEPQEKTLRKKRIPGTDPEISALRSAQAVLNRLLYTGPEVLA